ncbi:hypothetical protein [uncultured Algibacter sp.]|uniref:hypothetical protein n=1 Tax=uncultured Algibacter sp. TaxID=298659 RepID=UPI0032174959
MNKIIPLLAIIIFFGCANQSNYEYTIINEDIDNAFSKINIDIRLAEEVSTIDLRYIALELRKSRSSYDKIWIFYFLPGQEPGNGAWAISHFKPELELEILGASKEATNKMNLTKVSGNILSSWYDNDPLLSNRKYLVKEKGKTFIKTIYAESKYAGSGGELVEEVFEKQQSNGLKRYDYNNTHGEYYLIEKNGNLGLYDDSGKFKEAIKID